MHTDTLFLTALILAQTTITSLVRIGIEEVIIKPLAVRHTKRVLGTIADYRPILKDCWDLLDYSLTDSLDNVLMFLNDKVDYIQKVVLPRMEERELSDEQRLELTKYLSDNWSDKAFVTKVSNK